MIIFYIKIQQLMMKIYKILHHLLMTIEITTKDMIKYENNIIQIRKILNFQLLIIILRINWQKQFMIL